MQISPEALIKTACEQTGLDDFGGESFREGLHILCESVAAEAQLNPVGAMVVPAAILACLTNRLRVSDWVKRHPSVLHESIEAPLVVIGMFRAGTTFLSYLLENDPRHRPLLRWEAGDSVPPPAPQTVRSDPRIAAARAGAAMLDQINPAIRIVQNEAADGPTECISVLSQDFRSLLWEAMANVPSYGRWLQVTDHRDAYAYHKRVLQVLQSGGVRGRWSLKSPHHALHLEALTAVYPDARLVLMHRDPVVLCASVCSLITTLTKTFSDTDHSRYIAENWIGMLARSIASIDAFRAANPRRQIVDVQYSDLMRDPLGTVQHIYAAFGDELDGPARRAMARHVESHPRSRFGRHAYDLGAFGVAAAAIQERFRDYVQRYEIPSEQPAPP